MKMMSLRNRLFWPLAVLMIVLSVLIYVIFSIVMRAYSLDLAHKAVASTIQSVASIAEQTYQSTTEGAEAEDIDEEGEKRVKALEFLYETRRAIRRSQFHSSLIVLDSTFAQLFPSDEDEEVEAILSYYKGRMQRVDAPDLFDGEDHFDHFVDGENEYLAAILMLSDPDQMLSNYLIVFCSIGDTSAMLRVERMVVLGLLVLLTLVALVMSWRQSTAVSRPIKAVGDHMARVGSGQFEPMALDSHVEEIAALIASANSMAQRLERSDAAQKLFLQNASHELRTPLMSIQGYAEGIERGVLDDVKGAAGVIVQESHVLGRIVASLLTLSRIENDQQDVEIELIDLGLLLKNMGQRMQGMAATKEVEIVVPECEGEFFAWGDEELTGKAISNVLSNAVRYARHRVEIKLCCEGKYVVLCVLDDGHGIDPVDAPHLFERFYKGKGGQYGIGLALARSAMEYMGGSICVGESEQGASFELRFSREQPSGTKK